MTTAKNFQLAMSIISDDFFKANRFLDDKRLTQLEKKIIQGYGKLRSSNFDWILDQIPDLSACDEFVKGHKHLLLGITHNNGGAINLAETELLIAKDCFAVGSYDDSKFLVDYNLFVTYLNLGNTKKLVSFMSTFTCPEYKAGSHLWVRHQRMLFNLYSVTGDDTRALEMLRTMEKHEASLDHLQKISWLIDRLKYFGKNADFQSCYKLLADLKKTRLFYLSADYKFVKANLDYLTTNSTFYVYDRDFESIPLLFYQIKVLSALQEKQVTSAAESWKKLHEISPTIYLADFKYNGDVCLFSHSLLRLLDSMHSKTAFMQPNPLSPLSTKEELLFDLLSCNPGGIRKEIIHFKIWGVEPLDKRDYEKLTKLLQRVKLKYQISVISRKGSYELIHDRAVKKARG